MIKVKVPCSCGEFVQGLMGSAEALISCPIDIFSVITIEEATKEKKQIHRPLLPKTEKALSKAIEYFDISAEEQDSIFITIDTPLPYGKGYATSTAEIAGVIVGVGKYFDKTISEEDLAKLCIEIEPTDSTIFSDFVLFRHLIGEIVDKAECIVPLYVVILELDREIDTVEARNSGLFNNVTVDSEINFMKFLRGMIYRDLDQIGESITSSARLNQSILEKPYLESIISLAVGHHAVGVNVAHSGSLVGVFFKTIENADEFEYMFMTTDYFKEYTVVRRAKTISGGYTFID